MINSQKSFTDSIWCRKTKMEKGMWSVSFQAVFPEEVVRS